MNKPVSVPQGTQLPKKPEVRTLPQKALLPGTVFMMADKYESIVSLLLGKDHHGFCATSLQEFKSFIQDHDEEKSFEENFFHFLDLLYIHYIEPNITVPPSIHEHIFQDHDLQRLCVQYAERNDSKSLQKSQYIQLFYNTYLLSGKKVSFMTDIYDGNLLSIVKGPEEKLAQMEISSKQDDNESFSLQSIQLFHLISTISKICAFLHPGMKNTKELLSLRERTLAYTEEALTLFWAHREQNAEMIQKFENLKLRLQVNMASCIKIIGRSEQEIMQALQSRLEIYEACKAEMKNTPAEAYLLWIIEANTAIARLEARRLMNEIYNNKPFSRTESSYREFMSDTENGKDIFTTLNTYKQALLSQGEKTTPITHMKSEVEALSTPNDCAKHFIEHEKNGDEWCAKSLYHLIVYSDIRVESLKQICLTLIWEKQSANIYEENIRLNILEAATKRMTTIIEWFYAQGQTKEKEKEIMSIIDIGKKIWEYAESAKMRSGFIFQYIQLQYQLWNLYAMQIAEEKPRDIAREALIIYEQIIPVKKREIFVEIAQGKKLPEDVFSDVESRQEYAEWERLIKKISRGMQYEKSNPQEQKSDYLDNYIRSCETLKTNWLVREGIGGMETVRLKKDIELSATIDSFILQAEKLLSRRVSEEERTEITKDLCERVSEALFSGVCHIYITPKDKQSTLPLDLTEFCILNEENTDYRLCFQYSAMLEEVFRHMYDNNKKHLRSLGKLLLQEKSKEVTDSLTGLPNERKLHEDISIALSKNLSLIAFKYLDFHQLNAGLGQTGWDLVLIKLAVILEQLATWEGWKIYRYGGSAKFAILLQDVRDKKQIADICNKLQEAVESQIVISKEEMEELGLENSEIGKKALSIHPNLAFGAALSNKGLNETASLALNNAESTKNQVVIFNGKEDANQAVEDSLYWWHKIHQVLENPDLLVPYAQPIVDIQGKIVKYEILMRILDNDKVKTPNFFISAITEAKKWPQFTQMLIKKTLENVPMNQYALSFNIRAEDLVESFFVLLREKIAQGLNPKMVTFELLETSIFDLGENSPLAWLKNLWFQLSMDDFGAWYSNTDLLAQVSILDLINCVKIDRSLIKRLPETAPFIQAVVRVGAEKNLEVVAEWVDSKKIAEQLEEAGVRLFQGFYFGKPADISFIDGKTLITD